MLQDVPTMLGGRYRVVERLGRGGMADVYRAEDVVLRRAVAVKIFRGGVEREQHLARFRTEVRTLAALTHPHLVALYDAGGDVTEPWCAMEYVDGGSLADRDGPVPPGDVARIGEQVASGLAYVHGRGVVHRDVKPSNVLLDSHGDAFLSDFGIAKLVDGTRMTQSGLMIGTAAFLSPEQVRGHTAGPACDVYALGLVLLEALTGHREYPGSPVESAVARLSRPPHVPDEFAADWGELIAEMTAEDPDERPDPSAVARRLRVIARRLTGSVVEIPGAEAPAGEDTPTAEDVAPIGESAEPGSTKPAPATPSTATLSPALPSVPVLTVVPAPAGPPAASAGEPRSDDVPGADDLPGSDDVPGSAGEPPSAGGPRNLLGWFSPERRRRAGAVAAAAGVVVAVALALPLVDGRRADGVLLDSASDRGAATGTSAPMASDGADDGLQVRRAPVGDVPLTTYETTTRPSTHAPVRQPRIVAGVATTRDRTTTTQPSPKPSRTPTPSPSTSSSSPSPTASSSTSPSPSASTSVSPTPTGSASASVTSDPTSTPSTGSPSSSSLGGSFSGTGSDTSPASSTMLTGPTATAGGTGSVVAS